METKTNVDIASSRLSKCSRGVALVLVLLVATLTHAQLTPSDDAYVNSAAPTANYGSATTLNLSSSADTAFIRFDLTAVPASYTGSSVAKATLKLYVNSATTAGSFNVDYVTGTWTEQTIKYNLQPAIGATIAASVPLTTASKGKYVEIDITAAMVEWLNGTQTNDGIALVANSPLVATFDSKENTSASHPPELDVVFTTGGGITGITTASGSGLTGGGTSGTLNLSLTNACAANQVLEWNGTAWVCANLKGNGTITGVTAGTDLTGGGTSGNVTLNLDTTKVPQLSSANTFSANQTVNGTVTATSFSGSGASLTNVNASELGGVLPATYARLDGTAFFAGTVGSQGNIVADISNTNSGGYSPGLTFGNSLVAAITSKQTPGGNQNGIDFWTSNTDQMSITPVGYVGIGTTQPNSLLHLQENMSSALGPVLSLINGAGGTGAGGGVDFSGYDTSGHYPTVRMQSLDDGKYSSNLVFLTKNPGASTNPMTEQVRITDFGSLIVDSSSLNALLIGTGASAGNGLIFGGVGSGEGVASCRLSASACKDSLGYQHQYGLDFYTNSFRRMTIENSNTVDFWADMFVQGCTYWLNGNQQGTCLSDARLKTNIQPFPHVLEKLAQLEPVHFDWNPANPPELHTGGGRQTGLIAQQVEKVFPDMVSTDKDGYRRVNYGQLPYLLLEGVRELKSGNDSLSAQAKSLRKQNEQARAEIANLRRAAAATDAKVARLAGSSAAKDAQIALMSGEIEQLRKAQEQMAVAFARFAPSHAEHGKSQTAAARPALKAPAARVAETAHAQVQLASK